MNEAEINAKVRAAVDRVMAPLSAIMDPKHRRTSEPVTKDPSRSDPVKKDPAMSKAEWIFREKLAETMPTIVNGFGRFLARNNYDRKDFESFLQDLIMKQGFMTTGGKMSDVTKYVSDHRFDIMHDYFVRDNEPDDDNAGDPGNHDVDDPTKGSGNDGGSSTHNVNPQTFKNMNIDEIVSKAVAEAMAPFRESIQKIEDSLKGRDDDPAGKGDDGTGSGDDGTGTGDEGNDGGKKLTHEEWLESRMHRAVDQFTGKGGDDDGDDTFDPTANLDTSKAVDAWIKANDALKGKDI